MNKYQAWTRLTAKYPNDDAVSYLTLGLVGEAGEVANKVKKWIRGDKSASRLREELGSELGDILWYIARLCDHLDLDLDDVIEGNMEKLNDRLSRGVILGDGDNR